MPKEKPMKLMAFGALMVMFLMGGVVGSLAMNWYNRTHPITATAGGGRPPGTHRPPGGSGGPGGGTKLIDKLQSELKLTDEQTKQVKDIMSKTRDQFTELHNESRPKYIAIREQSQKDIKAILTPEQQSKLEALMKEGERERGDRGERGDREHEKEGSQRPH